MNYIGKIYSYYALNMTEYDMVSHEHNHYEIMFVLAGQCDIYINNELKILKANQLIIISRHINHRLIVKKGTACTLLNLEWEMINVENINKSDKNSIVITEAFMENQAFNDMWTKNFDYIILNDKETVMFAAKDLIKNLEDTQKDKYLIKLTFIKFLLEIAKLDKSNITNNSIKYVNKAKKFIEENLSSELTVDFIAENVNISNYYLQSLFSKHLNMGVMNYVNDLRISKACFLLKNSKLSVNDIAFEIGFNSRQHFAYTFSKRKKVSPYSYRKLHGQSLSINTKYMKVNED